MTKEEFVKYLLDLNIKIDEETLNKLELYKSLLQEWNNKFNLTTIISDEDIYLKHFYDSIYLMTVVDLKEKSLCDFGTGAGFPGMVLAIMNESTNVTLIESNNKKCTFLEEVKNKLNLENVNIINDRAEIYGKTNREKFDIVTCRAVSALSIILELAISMLKINGLFIPMKSNIEGEFDSSMDKAIILGYDFINKKEYELPIEKSNRTILIYKKIKTTDSKYPRNYNIIKKQ